MKRLTSVLVAIVIMMASVVSFADTTKRSDAISTVEEFCKKVLNGLCDLYDKKGGAIDGDYVELTYKYFQFWLSARSVYEKELQINIKENPLTGNMTFGVNASYENTWMTIRQDTQNEWMDYVNGKTDKKTYAKKLFSIVRSMMSVKSDGDV